MAVNQELGEVVLGALYDYVSSGADPSLKIAADGGKETGREIIKILSRMMVDEPHKVRIDLYHLIGYGYDFTKDDDGTSAKRIYTRVVKTLKSLGGVPPFETFVKEGVTNNRYGWYITRL